MTETITSFQTQSGAHLPLSNFYVHNGWTVEHEYQAAKTFNFADALRIRTAPTPGQAKRLGRKVKLREDWEEIKDSIMWVCLQAKFSIPELRDYLLNTGSAVLIEGNDWGDREWGACYPKGNREIDDAPEDHRWTREDGVVLVGRNMLGRQLMVIREQLRV